MENATPVNNVVNVPEKLCNCRTQENCPLSGNCLKTNIIYQATVASNINGVVKENKYIGLTGTTFKQRWSNHKTDMNLVTKNNSTSLSAFVWKLKEKGIEYYISWKVMAQASPFCEGSKKCNLCTTEKHYIIYHENESDINVRN